jgi:hypothetical protein
LILLVNQSTFLLYILLPTPLLLLLLLLLLPFFLSSRASYSGTPQPPSLGSTLNIALISKKKEEKGNRTEVSSTVVVVTVGHCRPTSDTVGRRYLGH